MCRRTGGEVAFRIRREFGIYTARGSKSEHSAALWHPRSRLDDSFRKASSSSAECQRAPVDILILAFGRKNMKSILLGGSILAGVVGLGSAGVYFARPLLTAAVPAAAEGQQVTAAENTLTPIPLSPAQQISPAAANPFARSNPAERVAVADDRYTTANAHANGDDGLQNDIPNAIEQMPATRTPDAFGLRDRPASASRYAEQTVSAETIEPEAEDSADDLAPVDEPRRLTSPSDASANRYRQPLDDAERITGRRADSGPARRRRTAIRGAAPCDRDAGHRSARRGNGGIGRGHRPPRRSAIERLADAQPDHRKIGAAGNPDRQAGQVRHQGPQHRLGRGSGRGNSRLDSARHPTDRHDAAGHTTADRVRWSGTWAR